MDPTYLIIPIGSALRDLKDAVYEPDLPSIDVEALLELVVDSIRYPQHSDSYLTKLPRILLDNDMLTSHRDLDVDYIGLEFVAHRAAATGRSLQRIFQQYQLFESNGLNFEFDRTLDERTIVLRKRGG